MTQLFAGACFVIAFTPALAIFVQVVAKDPLRVILFFLGAFSWLISVFLSGIVAIPLHSNLVAAIFFCVFIQEAARIGYFAVLHRAQKDLEKVASSGVEITSVRLSFASRHVLAVVCGLGFGVMAAVFLLVNVLADYTGEGIVGLTSSIPSINQRLDESLDVTQAAFPLLYSLSNCFLVMDHVAWTLITWDACHNYVNKLQPRWFISASFPILAHLANSGISLNAKNSGVCMVFSQAAIMIASIGYGYLIVKKPRPLRIFSNAIGIRSFDDPDSTAS